MSDLSPEQLETLLNGPAGTPPPGVIPQLDDPPNHSVAAISVIIISIVVATLATAMRLYTKARIIRQGMFVGYAACTLYSNHYAPGLHQWDVRLKNYGPFLYYVHVGFLLYGICTFFIKLSILIQYIQVFMPTREPKTMYWTTIFIIAANFIHYLASTFLEIFSCSPISKAWDPLITRGHCIDILVLNTASSGINTASDFIILILPQLIIWQLNISLKNKTMISIIFLVAIFACVSSVVRLSYAVIFQHQLDVTYYSWLAGIWTLPEMASGIAVACLPVVRGFFVSLAQSQMFSRITSSVKRFTSRSKSSSNSNASKDQSEDQDVELATGPKWDRAWVKAYGVPGLTSLPESQSVTGFRVSDDFGALPEDSTHQETEQFVHIVHTLVCGGTVGWFA
ncbi:hypothetical protein F4804DRAFT_352796 [Jackrogersella minutella]|nr:hypothetical protein F4804DRAFT_352796 [Jackrogersella minutella]